MNHLICFFIVIAAIRAKAELDTQPQQVHLSLGGEVFQVLKLKLQKFVYY